MTAGEREEGGGGCHRGPARAGLVKGACDVLTVGSAACKRRLKWRVREPSTKGTKKKKDLRKWAMRAAAAFICRVVSPREIKIPAAAPPAFDGRRRAGGSTSTHGAERLSAHVFAASPPQKPTWKCACCCFGVFFLRPTPARREDPADDVPPSDRRVGAEGRGLGGDSEWNRNAGAGLLRSGLREGKRAALYALVKGSAIPTHNVFRQ